MIKEIPSVFLLCLLLTTSCQKIKETSSTQTDSLNILSTKIDSIGNHFMGSENVMGISIAVVKGGEMIYNKGFGYVDSLKTEAVTNDHIFQLASISKLVGSTLVLRLVEEGKLSLNNTLLELLPDFPNHAQAAKIQLRHLLSHTSGLVDYATVIDSIYLKSGKAPTKADYFNFFKDHALQFEPGTQFSYSNSGFILMAMIVERITGNSFQAEIDRVINRSAGLHLKLIKESINNRNRSTYFELKDKKLVVSPPWTWIKGDGGLTTTAAELAYFAQKWADGKLISRQSFHQMITPTVLADGLVADYGLGVRIGEFEGEKVIGHSGGEKTTESMMVYFLDHQLSIVVMVNTDNTPSHALNIFGYVALAVLNKNLPDLKSDEIVHPNLDLYIGDYFYNDYYYDSMTFSFVRHEANGPLYFKFKGDKGLGSRLYYLGGDSFTDESLPMSRFVFKKNNSGEVIAVNEYLNGFFFSQFRKR